MSPSKISPTMRPSRSISGEPELPPMMSFVEARFIGVARSSVVFASSHDCGSAYGSAPVARAKSPPIVVYGGTNVPSDGKPFTAP